jgi:small subunit ribosomal protein S6
MREYELTVVYDLAVAEAGGPDASVEHLTNLVTSRAGTVLKVDHWGRRRLAYPVGRALDADYVVSRVELAPEAVSPLEAALRIDEKVYRHLVVRADEIPAPPPPREPRRMPGEAAPAAVEAAAPAAESPVAEAPAAEAPAAEAPAAEAPAAEAPATVAEAADLGAAEASPEPVPSADDAPTGEGEAPASGTIATDEPQA